MTISIKHFLDVKIKIKKGENNVLKNVKKIEYS